MGQKISVTVTISTEADVDFDPQSLAYEFEAKLDVGGFYPRVKILETGSFNLGQAPANTN